MIKKIGVLFLFLVILSAFVTAVNNTTTNNSIITPPIVSNNTSPTLQQNLSKLDKAYSCLENKTKSKCSTLSTQEIALTILAVPSQAVLTECRDALKARRTTSNCFSAGSSGSCTIKDTALAIIALNSLGENIDPYKNWLLTKNITSRDLIWYLQQDSNEASQCTISYDSNDYRVNIGIDKKISISAGSCLQLAQSNFWFQVSQNCYNKEFKIACDKDFIATLLYKQANSQTLFVLSDTPSKPAFGEIFLKIKAQCFSTSSSCDYEGSLWATIALLKTGTSVENFVPYVLALGESNKQYLPNAFIYSITSYQDYASKLIQQQQVGNYWLADSSANNRFYDTAIAILSLKDSSSPQVVNAKNWLLFSQPSTGCWQNTIKDTAIILWALTDRTASIIPGNTTTYCTQASYYCIPNAECPSAQLLNNYYCPNLGDKCCQTSNLKPCSQYPGIVCASGQQCSGASRQASDTNLCCLSTCVPIPTASECDNQGYSCQDSCSSTQESITYSCNSEQVCCRTKTTQATGSKLWLWILIAIIILLLIILFLARDRLRLWWFKIRNTREGSDSESRMPPRPGFPPIRPMPSRPIMPQQRQMQRPQPQPQRQMLPQRPPQSQPQKSQPRKEPDDVFKKLRDMSK